MNNRRKFLAAGGLWRLCPLCRSQGRSTPGEPALYSRDGLERQLAAPMNDWLIRLDAQVDVPIGNAPPPANPGFAPRRRFS